MGSLLGRKVVDELVLGYERIADARQSYNDAVEAVAKKTGSDAKALKRLVAAVARDRIERERESAQGALDLFDRYDNTLKLEEQETTIPVLQPEECSHRTERAGDSDVRAAARARMEARIAQGGRLQ